MLHRKASGSHGAGRRLMRVSARRAGCLGAAIALANLIGCLPAAAAPHETVLYAFETGPVGHPYAGLVMGPDGALYGTTAGNGTAGNSNDCSVVCGTVFMLAPGATSWSETTLHRFTGGADAATPFAGLVMDANGDLYGTTSGGGGNNGTVFELTPPAAGETRWTEKVLYRFKGGADGATPVAGLIMDANGALYGTTLNGGRGCNATGCGTVFELTPPAAGETRWTETVLRRFKGIPDGAHPVAGLIMDANGALYGTTDFGGGACLSYGCGTVFTLVPPAAGETRWIEKVLYRFQDGADGGFPAAGLIMDANGAALFGTTLTGGRGCNATGCGTVFELTPPAAGETRWTETVLYRFKGGSDGAYPLAGLIMDASGALYGTTNLGGGARQIGTVFKLKPPARVARTWTEQCSTRFKGGVDGAYPFAGLIMDAKRRPLRHDLLRRRRLPVCARLRHGVQSWCPERLPRGSRRVRPGCRPCRRSPPIRGRRPDRPRAATGGSATGRRVRGWP